MTKAHYYIISGLGADHRIFARLNLPKNHTHLAWIDNLPNEDLSSYAARMAKGIKHENPILIGLSFGGIICQEISYQLPIKQLILISTVKAKREKPWYINFSGSIRLPNLLPTLFIKKTNSITNWIFGCKSDEEKELLKSYLFEAKPAHIRWAMIHIALWDSKPSTTPNFHVHGKSDKVLPIWRVKQDVKVNGGHLALFTDAANVQQALDSKFN